MKITGHGSPAGDRIPLLSDLADQEHHSRTQGAQRFEYRKESPIIELTTPAEVKASADNLSKNSTAFDHDSPIPKPKFINLLRVRDDIVRNQKQWAAQKLAFRENISHVTNMADGLSASSGRVAEGNTKVFALKLGKDTVAQMTMRLGKTGYLQELVAHPGTVGGGQSMLEKAVKVSQESGHGGRVELIIDSKFGDLREQMAMYEHLGFVNDPPYDVDSPNAQRTPYPVMVLKPEESDKWTLQTGEWQLKNNLGKGYLQSTDGSEV